VTRDRARKKSVRAQMAASGEPYSVAARKLGGTGTAGEAARDEVITRVEATLAAASARIEVRKETTAGLALLRTAFSESALGIIEPSARRFQYIVFKQRHSALAQLALGLEVGPALDVGPVQNAHSALGEGPLELLMRLRTVTAARYAGEETVREARCRKIAVTVGGTPAVLTVWVDGEHVRQIQAVTATKVKRIAVTVAAATVVTAQLWDFGVPVDSMDWPRPSALWSKLARRPDPTRPKASDSPIEGRLPARNVVAPDHASDSTRGTAGSGQVSGAAVLTGAWVSLPG